MNDFYLSFETLFHLKMLANARWGNGLSLSQILMIFIFKIIQVDIMLWLYSLFISGINLPLAVDRALLESGATSWQLGGDGCWLLVPWSPGHTPGQPSSQPWNEGELDCPPLVAVPEEICHLCLTSCRSSPPFCLPQKLHKKQTSMAVRHHP